MINPAHLINRILNRASSRFRSARPGSVLILVVALLVLMALIGTAFITSAQVDRYSSTQNTYNTQVDLLIQGVLNMAESQMLAKLQSPQIAQGYRSGTSAQSIANGPYRPWESATTDTYLADRIPIAPWQNSSFYGSAVCLWPNITAPVTGVMFETPYAIDAATKTVLGAPFTFNGFDLRTNAVPTSITLQQPDGSYRVYPALTLKDTNPKTATYTPFYNGMPFTVIAADTDGDGIADACFVRLPGGQVEGATYYAAVRIIDNAAAINASTAIEVNRNLMTNARTVAGDLFPVNVDLGGTITTGDSMAALNQYRFNGIQGGTNAGNGMVYNATPVDDLGTPHSELFFNTAYEAFWTQLAQRLNNPGFNSANGAKYQALPPSEALALAYHFCLSNPNASISPILETMLQNSTGINATSGPPALPSLRSGPFSPGDSAHWFNIFNYPNPMQQSSPNLNGLPIRPLLTVRSPVSNAVPNYFSDQGFYSNPPANLTIYNFGDWVRAIDPLTQKYRAYVCVQPNAPGTQAPSSPNLPTIYNTAFWSPMPWTNQPTKINVNTATFDQLWLAYWSVMLDHPDLKGNLPTGPGWGTGILDGPPANHQFRNPVRGNRIVLTNQGVTLLRAALAAVNTMDMRDGDDDITSRTIHVPNSNSNIPAQINVFGAEKQPYITEVMVDYDPDGSGAKSKTQVTPWVAVELYNPHPTRINLINWKFCYLNRGSMALQDVGDLVKSMASYTHPDGGTGAYILPGERIVFDNNFGFCPKSVNVAWATMNPPLKAVDCVPSGAGAGMELAVGSGNELVLIRPRRADGTLTSSNDPQNLFNEGSTMAPNLYDFVPLDTIDMGGISYSATPPQGQTTAQEQRFRYARANTPTVDDTSSAWHCVYPGPYSLAGFTPAPPVMHGGQAPSSPFHMWGFAQVNATPANPDNGMFGQPKGRWPSAQPNMVTGGPYPYATYETRALQINNRNSAGPNSVYATNIDGSVGATGPQYLFPYGGFARDGDILQVPFIGSYRIIANNNTVEFNSVTIDSVMAQWNDPATACNNGSYTQDVQSIPGNKQPNATYHNEQIGHFCPMDIAGTDFADDPSTPQPALWRYHFAKRLFDYLSVSTPQDAYLPNVDPAYVSNSGVPASGDPTLAGSNFNSQKYPVGTAPAPVAVPTAQGLTLNSPQSSQQLATNQQLQGLEDAVASEGRININTSSWKALSAIPFFTPNEAIGPYGNYQYSNAGLAFNIVQFRETTTTAGHISPGPFTSIFDLMQVPAFHSANWSWMPQGTPTQGTLPGEVRNQYGDFSPSDPVPAIPNYPKAGQPVPLEMGPTDHVVGDVKTRFLLLQRISNLITTRSDAFTVYVQVQGWQNIGASTLVTPTLVVTKRAAILVDRSQAVPVRNQTLGTISISPMGVTNVPND